MRYRYFLWTLGLIIGCGGEVPVQNADTAPVQTADIDETAADEALVVKQASGDKLAELQPGKETVKVLPRTAPHQQQLLVPAQNAANVPAQTAETDEIATNELQDEKQEPGAKSAALRLEKETVKVLSTTGLRLMCDSPTGTEY